MFAIIKTGGKQIKVSKDDEIYVEKLDIEEGKKVIFDEILMIDGTVGSPLIKGAAVIGTVVKQGKGKKLRVVRYHPKKNVNKVYGHRQPYTKVKIEEISLSGTKAITNTSTESKTAVAVQKTASAPKTASTGTPKAAPKPKTTTGAPKATAAKPKTTSAPKAAPKPKTGE
ncbi:50S ribosomal protein L21 [Spiroplasma floricola 23-6]|uniref:Large ribosomal subunit protein bL21 n=1 Tax=Spiroplasma floricola 23-6 TaxID=1336749 RepID=A0A2K8SES6_9MOLU|nr:50S ribosomal protein L21 [Spiroplasma floricola 23-6]